MHTRRLSSGRAPAVQHVLYTLAHLPSSSFPVDARHQQPVIVGVDVPDRRRNGERYGVGIKGLAGRATSDPAAATGRRMTRDLLGSVEGAAREQRTDRGGKLGRQTDVLVGSSRLVAAHSSPATKS